MILNSLFKIILNFVIMAVNFLLTPLDLLISQFLPDLNNVISAINDFIDFIINNINFAINLTLLPNWVIVVIADYIVFKLTVSISTYVIKIALKWYNYLKG